MNRLQRILASLAVLISTSVLANAQVGLISNPPTVNSALIYYPSAASPILRPGGYTELVGDIVISCTGGALSQVGTPVPTATVIVYTSPAVPITSRSLQAGPFTGSFASEAMLIIDDAGANLRTGATGGYGPQAPQWLCTSVQQQQNGGSACAAQVGLDNSGQYQVSVVPGTSKPAQNVYQGEVGVAGYNSVAFYNVPVLPPAYSGVSRTFRITNLRIPIPGENITETVQALIVTTAEWLPVSTTQLNLGVVGPAASSSVTSMLTIYPASFDLNGDGAVNVGDVQMVISAAAKGVCIP